MMSMNSSKLEILYPFMKLFCLKQKQYTVMIKIILSEQIILIVIDLLLRRIVGAVRMLQGFRLELWMTLVVTAVSVDSSIYLKDVTS